MMFRETVATEEMMYTQVTPDHLRSVAIGNCQPTRQQYEM